ncbi:integrase catalytic subunit, partial [Candidatus Regiella insecticola 5.15]
MKQRARKAQACQVIGISVRTLQRWSNNCHNAPLADKRSTAVRNAPSNKLSDAERQRIMEICNSPEFSS